MTQAELDEIEKRANAATPGPWRIDCRSCSNEQSDPSWPETDFLQFHVQGTDVVPMNGFHDPIDGRKLIGPKEVRWGRGDYYGRDADFIAHAREDIPKLIARVRELEKIVARLKDRAGWAGVV